MHPSLTAEPTAEPTVLVPLTTAEREHLIALLHVDGGDHAPRQVDTDALCARLTDPAAADPPIFEITGHDLQVLLREQIAPHQGVNKVSVALDGGVKVKVNEDGWTPPLGALRT